MSASRQLRRQTGMVLITTLLLLVIVTLLALSMFRGMGLETRIAGNTLEKQRALQAATSAQQYAEQWLVLNVTPFSAVDCSSNPAVTTTTPTVCSNILSNSVASVTSVPWTINATQVGYPYNPTNSSGQSDFQISSSGGVDTFQAAPVFYISQLGQDATFSNGIDYRIDAWSYAGAQSTVAVVESTYRIRFISKAPGP
jgi:type IV pilus assembly protein PilX